MRDEAQDRANLNEAGPAYIREVFAGRGRLLPILCAFLLILPIALLGSAYAPQEDESLELWAGELGDTGYAVGAMMDIEDIWAIEDDRTESETPLVTAMFNGSDSLGYDAESATFYCTLGMDNGAEWPELSLTAKGAEGVRVVWVDDYRYDWCSDAVADGVRYELLAYTQKEFSYIGVVFTGLPIVTLRAQEEIGWEDVTGEVHVSGAGYEALHSMARLHLRGGNARDWMRKAGYHIELRTMASSGHEHAANMPVLGMESDTDWLLIDNDDDESSIRNHVSWLLWRGWTDEGGVMRLESRQVELFLNNEYMGLYQLMQRVNVKRELERLGADMKTAVVGRKVRTYNETERPTRDFDEEHKVELRYAPDGMDDEEALGILFGLIELEEKDGALSDAEFAELAAKHLDMREAINYFLFFQMDGTKIDNIDNNVYIWAVKNGDGEYVYHLAPWDMDNAFRPFRRDITIDREGLNLDYRLFNRILDLNVGNSREILWELWEEKRSGVISEDAVYQLMTDAVDEVMLSGAYTRNWNKWHGGEWNDEATWLRGQAIEHMHGIEDEMKAMWPLQ